MALHYDWTELAALAIVNHAIPKDRNEEISITKVAKLIQEQCPFAKDVAYKPVDQPTLLQCVSCRNTESPAGALGRFVNRGRCLHCGGLFTVLRA